MRRFNSIGLVKRSLIGLFAIIILILAIPLLILVSQERQNLHGQIVEVAPTVSPVAFFSGKATVAGYVYQDTNRDGQREEEEKSFPDVRVEIKELKNTQVDGQLISEAKTDSYGYFNFHITVNKSSAYMVKVFLPQWYKSVNSNPLIISDLSPNVQKIVEFGLVPTADMPTPTPTRKPVHKATPTPLSTETPSP